jgi:hypothetical protein
MTRAHARAAALVTLAAAALASRPAAAYVRYMTKGTPGNPPVGFQWPQSCVPIIVYPNDLTDMPPDQTIGAAVAAAAAWSEVSDPCTYMDLMVSSSDGPTPTAKLDYYNNVIFQPTDWCGVKTAAGTCSYDPQALAITSVFAGTVDGKIRDADVEVNARFFTWADVEMNPGPGKQDLQNALTHEFGHLIGLDHTCYSPGPNTTRPFDNSGAPVPDCNAAPPEVQQTTMFASAIPGDTAKRTLAPDDQLAVCEIYPVAQDPMTCPPAGTQPATTSRTGCQCALGPAPGPGLAALLASLAALSLLIARRRARGRGR